MLYIKLKQRIYLLYSADAFYSLPSTKMNRTTSFGYGLRVNIENVQRVPPPNIYKIPSHFEFNSKKAYAYSFGTPSNTAPKAQLANHPNIPGPGSYNVLNPMGKESVKYTFRPRYKDLSNGFKLI